MPQTRFCLFLPIVLLAAAFAQDSIDRITAEAQKPSSLETNLQQLTDQIGGRVPGTPAMQKAVDWVSRPSRPRVRTAFTPKTSRFRHRGRKAQLK